MGDAVTFVRTDEQNMLADTVRDFLVSAVDLDDVRALSLTDTAIHTGAWDGLKEMGLVGLHVPDQYGGAGFSFVETAIVFEELGRRVVPVPLLSSLLASVAILESGSDEQKTRLLPPIASGEEIATLAVHESAHADNNVQCRAEPTDSGWEMSGTKRFVTDAPNADTFVVSAETGEGVGLFVVRRNDEGVSVTAQPALDATRPLGQLTLDRVVVDIDLYLGSTPHPEAASTALDHGVVALAQEQVGGAQSCLEMSVEYAKTRFQFGRAIGSFQAVKHMCADMLVSVEHARSVAWHAARSVDDPQESQIAVPLAKSVCSDAYVRAAGDTIQIHGGIGFTWEHDAHLYLKRAKSTSILLGSVDSYRDRLATAVGI